MRSRLEGATSRAIEGLPLSSNNYDSAVEILKQRAGKTEQTITIHMEEFLKLQPCLTDCPSSLRFFYDKLSVYVRGVSSLRLSSQEYGSLLIPIIMSKLPNEMGRRSHENRSMRYEKSMCCWTHAKEKLERVKLVRLSKHKKSRYENRQTLDDRFLPRMYYLRRSAKSSSFDAFIALGSIVLL